MLDRFARHELETALEALNADGGAIFALSRAFTANLIREAQRRGEAAGVDADQAAELLVRLGVSFVLIPSTALPLDDEAAARALARRRSLRSWAADATAPRGVDRGFVLRRAHGVALR